MIVPIVITLLIYPYLIYPNSFLNLTGTLLYLIYLSFGVMLLSVFICIITYEQQHNALNDICPNSPESEWWVFVVE